MKEIVVFGAGVIAALAELYFREDAQRRVAAFTVDAAFSEFEVCWPPASSVRGGREALFGPIA